MLSAAPSTSEVNADSRMNPFQFIVQIFDSACWHDPNKDASRHSQVFLILNLSTQESNLLPESNLPFNIIALVSLVC